jgi:hypothetical protein
MLLTLLAVCFAVATSTLVRMTVVAMHSCLLWNLQLQPFSTTTSSSLFFPSSISGSVFHFLSRQFSKQGMAPLQASDGVAALAIQIDSSQNAA